MNRTEYVPGVCNIGPAEIRRRQFTGWVGLAGVVLLGYTAVADDWSAPARALIGLPAGLAAVGFLQAYLHFCAGFGVLGVRNMGKTAGQTETVDQAEFRRRDQRRAWQIIAASGAVALVGAGLAVACL